MNNNYVSTNESFSKITRTSQQYEFDEWEGKQKSDKRNKPKRDRRSKREY